MAAGEDPCDRRGQGWRNLAPAGEPLRALQQHHAIVPLAEGALELVEALDFRRLGLEPKFSQQLEEISPPLHGDAGAVERPIIRS